MKAAPFISCLSVNEIPYVLSSLIGFASIQNKLYRKQIEVVRNH